MQASIGLDLGGTSVKAVLLNEDGEVTHSLTNPIAAHEKPQDEWHWKGVVRDTYLQLKNMAGGQVAAVGLSAPGIAKEGNTAIFCMPGRFYGLEQFGWSDYIGERVAVLNDAHSALMAEAGFGAAKGCQNAVLLTLGTGVGGGILIGGKLYQGFFQMAGHLGHVSVDSSDDYLSITGMPGSIEDAMGNATIGRRSHGRFPTTHALVDAYRRGDDPFATWLWLNSVRKLAVNIASLCNALSPEVVVLGGGIAKSGEALFEPLAAFMDVHEWRPGGKKTPIVRAHFGEFAGAIGAAVFAKRMVNDKW